MILFERYQYRLNNLFCFDFDAISKSDSLPGLLFFEWIIFIHSTDIRTIRFYWFCIISQQDKRTIGIAKKSFWDGKIKIWRFFCYKESNNEDFSPKETVESYRISVSIKYLLFAHVFKRLAQKLGGFETKDTLPEKDDVYLVT